MCASIKDDAFRIIDGVIADNMPRKAVEDALRGRWQAGTGVGAANIYLIALGKAAWTMAQAAVDFLGDRLVSGIVVTKYGHAMGPLPRVKIYESGHPISDENTIIATQSCIELAESLKDGDELLFLVSGGGSALFEKPLEGISLEDIQGLTGQFLACGADIVEINMVRKRLSAVKAGRFAKLAAPAKIFAVVLSDVLGDSLDSIASGPAAADSTTVEDALRVIAKYDIKLTDLQQKYLREETPKEVDNVETVITGSVRTLCEAAAKAAKSLGYEAYVLTTSLNCEASEAGRFLATIASDTRQGYTSFKIPCAIIAGGETVVTLKAGNPAAEGSAAKEKSAKRGKGGRNQELALAATRGIAGLNKTLIFSIGSDGTDGPTDAAGGIIDGESLAKFKEQGLDVDKFLAANDSYNALKAIDGLIITGPTGTNVNDVAVILCS